jgi:hypothetical protein
MTMAFPEGADENVQRALNDAKRAELSEKFGGLFIEGDSPLPAEIECEFLQRIEEFELKWASHQITTVRAFIGDPPIRPAAELSDSELEEELVYLLSALDENDVEIDFCERPDDREVYRFITEELLEHEIDDIRVPGMVCHFIYEEFHPNPEAAARAAVHRFIGELFESTEGLLARLESAQEIDAEGIPIDFEPLRQCIVEYRSGIASIFDFELDVTSTCVDGNDCRIGIDLHFTGLEAGTMNQLEIRAPMTIDLRYGAYGNWEITAFTGGI